MIRTADRYEGDVKPTLKACPFCGAAAELKTTYQSRVGKYHTFAECKGCGARCRSIRSFDNPAESGWTSVSANVAAQMWNRRA